MSPFYFLISFCSDAIVMCFINGMTSILAGFAIFSILGFMSHVAAKPIAEIVKPGNLNNLIFTF